MQTLTVYVANDGTEFRDEAMCLRRDRALVLAEHVNKKCELVYDEYSYQHERTPLAIAEYIIDHFSDEEFIALITKKLK